MKTRTLLLPAAFVVPVLLSTVPQSGAASADPVPAQPNGLVGELDTVAATARESSVLRDGRIVAAITVATVPTHVSCGRGASALPKPAVKQQKPAGWCSGPGKNKVLKQLPNGKLKLTQSKV